MTNKHEFQGNELLYKCVSCGKYYEVKKPRKGRKFCSNTCRAFHWYQKNPDCKQSLGQGVGTDELIKKIAEKDALIRSLQKQNAEQYQDLKNENAELFNQNAKILDKNKKLKMQISQVQGTLNYQNQKISELQETNKNIENSVQKIETNTGIGRQILIAGGGNLLAKLGENTYRKVRGQMTDREILLEIQQGTIANHNLIKQGTIANHNLIKQVPKILNNAKPQLSRNQIQDYRRLKMQEQKRNQQEIDDWHRREMLHN